MLNSVSFRDVPREQEVLLAFVSLMVAVGGANVLVAIKELRVGLHSARLMEAVGDVNF